MKKIICILLIINCVVSFSWAVRAYPKPITITQPDGTEITICMHGDENFHYETSEDGYLLRRNAAGIFEYAILNEEQKIKPIGVKAHEINERDDAEKQVLANLQKNVLSKKQVQAKRQAIQQQKTIDKPEKAGVNLASRGLLILAEFKDIKFQEENSQQAMSEMMNGDNYTHKNGAMGSVRQYFSEQSNGAYTPEFDVVGPVTLPKTRAYYGENNSDDEDKLPGDLIVHACSLAYANHDVDFSLYDNDNNGYVDFVYVLYAGYSESSGASSSTIWPHAWTISGTISNGKCSSITPPKYNGKIVDRYACSSELRGSRGTIRDGIGTFCHEFSHVLGLADYYATDYGKNDNKTLGDWHIMDHGNYNNNSNTPPNYSAYDRYFLGWLTPTIISRPESVVLQELCASNTARVITADGNLPKATSNVLAYYLENRQKKGWDAYLPGHGLLITRVQYNARAWESGTVNNGTPMLMDIIEADGKKKSFGSASDTYPGTAKITSFTPFAEYPITEIAENDSVISFLVRGDEICENISVIFRGDYCNETDGEMCIESGSTYVSTIIAKEKYMLTEDDFLIKMGDIELTAGVDFTYADSILTVPNVVENLVIVATANKQSTETIECSDYSYTFTSLYDFKAENWGDYTWTITADKMPSFLFDKTRGIQIGMSSSPAKSIVFSTSNSEQCCIAKITVTAAMGTGGDAQLAAFIDEEQIGTTTRLTQTSSDYEFVLNSPTSGIIKIHFTNTTKTIFLKKIAIEYCTTDVITPTNHSKATVVNTVSGLQIRNIPQNAEIKIINMLGQSQANIVATNDICDIALPKGVYLVQVISNDLRTTLKAIVR